LYRSESDAGNHVQLNALMFDFYVCFQEGRLEESKLIVVSLSIQPILSLAVRYEMTPDETALRLAGYFKELGADLVVDMGPADDFALLEAQRDFIDRYQAAKECGGDKRSLPMLASSCPGWVCYAEKTHGNFILPYISTAKSPQQIMGSLVKYELAERLGKLPDKVYHVTLMPCYDKKLEASREDFYNQLLQTREVDCVITSIEMEQLMLVQNKSLSSIEPCPLDSPWDMGPSRGLLKHRGSGSGGYADHVFLHAAKQLFGDCEPQLEYKTLR
jgi:iron only hydrogenase large subunit-like protein